MEQEIWKDVVGWEGLYQVSNIGRVRSLDRIVIRSINGNKFVKGVLLKLQKDKDERAGVVHPGHLAGGQRLPHYGGIADGINLL